MSVDARLVHHDRLEAALERAVLLDVLAVLVERGGADALQLAARQRRLEHVRGVDRALRAARADDGVQLVDEDHRVLGLADLVHHGLEPLLELAAVLGAGDHRREVERDDALVLEALRHLRRDDALRQALGDRGLADARLADQHRVVLLAARQHLDDALDLLLAPDHRVELALARELGEVAAELVRAPASRDAPRARCAPDDDGVPPSSLSVSSRTRLRSTPSSSSTLAATPSPSRIRPEQQVLGADVVVAERARLLDRQLEHALGARRERDLADGHGAARGAHHVLDLLADAVEIEPEVVEHRRGDALALADDAEQQVLGADVVVLQPRRFLARQVDDLADPFRELVVHGVSRPPRPRERCVL